MSGELGGLLTKKQTFLFKKEATPGVDPVLDESNAVEVSEPDYTTDVTVLERDYVSNDLSPFENLIGRIVSGFQVTTEIRGNGRQQSGLLADAPVIAQMIEACGYELVAMTSAGTDTHSPVIPDPENPKTSPVVTWTPSATATTNLQPVLYTIEVVTGGASGTAEVLITSNSKADEGDAANGDVIAAPAPETITTATALTLGAKGGETTPVFTGDLTVGQKWSVCVFPVGIKAVPVSSGQTTGYMKLNKDGVLLEGSRGYGTFTMECAAGQLPRATFNFTTNFIQPKDDPLPEVDFGNLPLPPQVELATLTWGGNRNLVVEQFTYDQANDVQARPSVNGVKGYIGSRIVSRAPSIAFNPEATHEADHPFWDEFTNSKSKVFLTRVGTEVGNQMVMFSGKAQTSDQTFGDRNGLMTYEKTVMPKRIKGDDETIFVFC